ncbi:DNA adenine methylase [Neolewinella agarilytica]|nr:DNA adenine methylase [Neolewinella agarilytica]
MMNRVPTRPVIRYYGGKWRLADWVIEHFPKHRCYVEGFGGAGSVLMKKKPARVEIYNDLNQEIVNLFKVLRDKESSSELRRLLDLTPYSRDEFLACYELSELPIEQARRTVVLAMQAHNPAKSLDRKANGWRSSTAGHHIITRDFKEHTKALELITDRLKGVIIENHPAQKICEQHDRPDTLHYLDPPYPGATRSSKGKYYKHELRGMDAHKELFDWANKLTGMVILSGYQCQEYEDWYGRAGWEKRTKTAQTGAFCGGAKTAKATEMLWLNPLVSAMQRQQRLF